MQALIVVGKYQCVKWFGLLIRPNRKFIATWFSKMKAPSTGEVICVPSDNTACIFYFIEGANNIAAIKYN